MALTATFTANFSSFYDAVAKADKALIDFGAGADKVGGKLDKLSTQFSGKDVIQQATLMAKAVEDIGGTSKLTEKELARLGATTNEAVAKMRALGMDVPKNLQAIADQTKGANKASTDWMGTLGKMAATMGVAFSVDALVGFVGSVFDAAGAVKDLSEQWGVSTKAVQQWSAAAKMSGVEAETVGKSVTFMTEQLSESSDAYRALLKNVGLSADELRKMPIEQAYRQIVGAVSGIQDETLQLDVAMGLLGPKAKQMVGAFRDGFLEVADGQRVMTEQTIDRLEAAGDAWETLKNKVITLTGEMIAGAMNAWDSFQKDAAAAQSGWSKLWGDIKATATGGLEGHRQYIAGLATATSAATSSLQTTTTATAGLASTVKTSSQVLADQKRSQEAATKATAAAAKAAAEAKKDQDAYTRSLEAHTNAVGDLVATWSGGTVVGKANLYLEALEASLPVQQMTRKAQDEINGVMKEAIDWYEAAGAKAPPAFVKIELATRKVADAFGDLNAFVRNFDPASLQLPTATLGVTPPPPGMFDGMAKGLVSSMSGSILKAIQGGGSILSAAGSSVGSFILDPKLSGVGKAVEGAAKKLPALIGGAVSAAIPVVGSLIGPAVTWLAGKMTSWFGKKEHEKIRDAFVTAAGGLDVLTATAARAGVSLDALFDAKKTDGVKGAIEDLNAAFAFQTTALDAAKEAATRYGFTLEELGPAFARQQLDDQAQQLFKDWEVLNAAGIDAIAITGRMSDSVSTYVNDALKMGLEVPAAMRPMLEAFAKSGKLLDENGDAITDLEGAGVTFALTMSQGFRDLIDEVHKLTDAISRSLTTAIENVPDVTVKGTVEWDDPGLSPAGPHGGRAPEGYARGTDGFKNFGAGTPVVLHGWEAVVPRDQAGAFATVARSSSGAAAVAPTTIVIHAEGAFFDTPDSLQRLAAKVGDALTARAGLLGKLRAAV